MLRPFAANPNSACSCCRPALAAFPAAAVVAVALAGCSPHPDSAPANSLAREAAIAAPAATQAPAPDQPQPPPAESLSARLEAIGSAVGRWRMAGDLAAARRNAEEARNLIVGPAGPFYGDGDGDGAVAGASAAGLLPGLNGESGIVAASPNACVIRDVLGGSWSDPALRWAILRTAIADWKPGNNTFPALPSHPQRIVGWATLALAAGTAAEAREYARHAQIHAELSSRAVRACGA